MALVLGTNCGFVTVSPTDDPAAIADAISNTSRAVKGTAPVGATKITEVGWWCDNATQATNFEIGLYAHNVSLNEPAARIYIAATNAKDTNAGWKKVTVDWDITAGTIYWIAVQVDATATTTNLNYGDASGASRYSYIATETTLLDPWPTSSEATNAVAIYAVVGAGATYSELAGTIEGVGTPSGNLGIASISELSGTIAGVGAMSGNLGSTVVGMDVPTSYCKRLIVAGKDSIWYESI